MKALLTSVFLLLSGLTSAQNTSGAGSCGTMTPQSEVNKIYDFVQHNPLAYAKTTVGTIDSIPLSIHLVGTDDGKGYFLLNNLFNLLCQLNTRYTPVGFRFYIQWPIEYIPNSSFYEHDFYTGEQMMNQYNVPNTANVYFVKDPAGNCGYYDYYGDAVAIGISCAGSGSTTLTHELGHFFSLPHTFYGWENGNTPGNPELVRRSGPGTNCNSAGDGFCDTYADYISVRWTCPYPTQKTDNYGDQYHLDSSIYMSYSLDVCQSRFSNQQVAAMQYNLHNSRQSYSGATRPAPKKLDSTRIIYPADTLYANQKKVSWRKVPGADFYFVRIGLQSAPGFVVQSSLTKDTVFNITYGVVDGGQYILQVSPVNSYEFCLNYTSTQWFSYTDKYGNVGVTGPTEQNGLLLYPSPLSQGQALQMNFHAMPVGSYEISLSSLSGQQVLHNEYYHSAGQDHYSLGTQTLADGIYFLRWSGPAGQGVQRVQIGR